MRNNYNMNHVAEQGNIVGREYIHFVKNAGNPSFLMPF
jgi:hypothetical protein